MARKNKSDVWGIRYKTKKDMKPVLWEDCVIFSTNSNNLSDIASLIQYALNLKEVTLEQTDYGPYNILNGAGEALIGRDGSLIHIYSKDKSLENNIKDNLKSNDYKIHSSYNEFIGFVKDKEKEPYSLKWHKKTEKQGWIVFATFLGIVTAAGISTKYFPKQEITKLTSQSELEQVVQDSTQTDTRELQE